jgi:hypothetical protein
MTCKYKWVIWKMLNCIEIQTSGKERIYILFKKCEE